MTASEDRLEGLIRELKADLTKRMDELNVKIDRASDFQTVFAGVVKILSVIAIVGGGFAAIYLAIHSGGSGK